MYDTLLDDRAGVIRELRPREIPDHFPPSFALTHAVLSDTTAFCPWPADASGAGYAFADPTAVRGAAIGEAVERYCGNLVPPGLIEARFEDLADAVGPAEVCLYSPAQYASPGFPAEPLGSALTWAAGTDVVTGAEVHVPAALVWPSWFLRGRRPVTNPIIQAGLAAGRTHQEALDSALREIVERDAMTLCWYGGRGLLDVTVPRWLTELGRGPLGALDTRFLAFPDDYGTTVLGALVHDRATGYLTLGTGVQTDPEAAALKAFGEALQLQLFSADLDDPDGAFARVAALPGCPLRPWRADRRYAASYAPDLSDVVDYGCHLQLHLDPTVQERFHRELGTALIGACRLDELTSISDLLDEVAARHRVLAVDVTTPDVASAGLHVVRVVVPGTYSNSAIGMPFEGGTRFAAARRDARCPRPTLPLPH